MIFHSSQSFGYFRILQVTVLWKTVCFSSNRCAWPHTHRHTRARRGGGGIKGKETGARVCCDKQREKHERFGLIKKQLRGYTTIRLRSRKFHEKKMTEMNETSFRDFIYHRTKYDPLTLKLFMQIIIHKLCISNYKQLKLILRTIINNWNWCCI